MHRVPLPAAIPILRRHVDQAYEIADVLLSDDIFVEENDHLGFMALCFSYKQLAHAKSVLLLQDGDQHIDAVTVSRVMLEGLILIAWSSLAPMERPLRWRAFSLVNDWKVLYDDERRGKPVSVAKKAELEERLKGYSAFLSNGARKPGFDKQSDPYQSTWRLNADGSKVELRKMVDDLGDPNLKLLYDELSQASHWTPRGVAVNIERTEGGAVIDFRSDSLAAMSYAVTFESLVQTLIILMKHLRIGEPVKLESLAHAFVTELSDA